MSYPYCKKRKRTRALAKIFRSAITSLFSIRSSITAEMSVRWSFKANQWEPSRSQLLQISSVIQQEEKARIAKFHFLRDAKSSLVGRLLLRKLVNMKTGAPNHLITLGRDEHNKPVLISPKLSELEKFQRKPPQEATDNNAQESNNTTNEEDSTDNKVQDNQQQLGTDKAVSSAPVTNLNFNVSHQGKFVVLVSEPSALQVGIDVMNVEKPGRITDSVDDYFRLMNRQFTENEWKQIKTIDPSIPQYFHNKAKLTNFTRFWCLKESYVKAVGVGIVIDLRSIDFTTKTDIGPDLVTDTTIKVDGVHSPQWRFEERFLDELHIVTVARCHAAETSDNNEDLLSSVPEYEVVSLDFLLDGMTTLGSEDHDWVDEFLKKK